MFTFLFTDLSTPDNHEPRKTDTANLLTRVEINHSNSVNVPTSGGDTHVHGGGDYIPPLPEKTGGQAPALPAKQGSSPGIPPKRGVRIGQQGR